MPNIFVELTISLDGYVAGSDVTLEAPLGKGGDRLFEWFEGGDSGQPSAIDREIATNKLTGTGAIVMGRRMFDVGEEPWGDKGAFERPCFVVTNRPRQTLVKGPTTFTFVKGGFADALAQARAAAGEGDVCVIGGANIAQQALAAGVVDELRIHVVPVLLGAGIRLFDDAGPRVELLPVRMVDTAMATHLTYRVLDVAKQS